MTLREDPYRRYARIYDRLAEPLNSGVRRVATALVDPQPGWRVLDVGCGTGTGLVPYRDAGCDVVGVDMSPAMLQQARARLGTEVDLQLTDGRGLPFPDGRFDLVTTSLVLHEVPQAARDHFIGEMARVAAAAGQIVVIDFRFGSNRGWKGPAVRVLTAAIERVSGHYDGYRTFKADGGVGPLLEGANLPIVQEKIMAGGNLAVYVAAAPA